MCVRKIARLFQLKRDIESFGSNSICVDAIQSSSSCDNDEPILPLCVAQESFTINGTNQNVVYLGGTVCKVITNLFHALSHS